jgi:hypothetical protein
MLLATRNPHSSSLHLVVAGDATLQGGHGNTPFSLSTASTSAQQSPKQGGGVAIVIWPDGPYSVTMVLRASTPSAPDRMGVVECRPAVRCPVRAA